MAVGNGTKTLLWSLIGVLAGVTVSGSGYFLISLSGYVPRPEIVEMIKYNSPYLSDKALIFERLTNLAETQREMVISQKKQESSQLRQEAILTEIRSLVKP